MSLAVLVLGGDSPNQEWNDLKAGWVSIKIEFYAVKEFINVFYFFHIN